jgi:chromosome segregation ATPase
MATVEERLAFVEGRVQELSGGYVQLREDIRGLQARVEALDQRLSTRIDALDQRLSSRIDALDQKVDRYREELAAQFAALDQRLSSRMDALDQKVDRYREELAAQIRALDAKLSAWLRWLVGILVVGLVGQLGVLARAVLR